MAVIHPYAGYASKNWLDERFSELIEVLCKDYNIQAILVGSKDDKEKINNIIAKSKTREVNIAGKTTLSELLVLIKRADIFIGVDSGPSHIAASVERPSVILYSGTNDPREWGVRNPNAVVIQKDITCKGCERLDCEENICMDMISVEDVLEAVQRVLVYE